MKPMTPEERATFERFASMLEHRIAVADAKRAYREACGEPGEFRFDDFLSAWEMTHIKELRERGLRNE